MKKQEKQIMLTAKDIKEIARRKTALLGGADKGLKPEESVKRLRELLKRNKIKTTCNREIS